MRSSSGCSHKDSRSPAHESCIFAPSVETPRMYSNSCLCERVRGRVPERRHCKTEDDDQWELDQRGDLGLFLASLACK